MLKRAHNLYNNDKHRLQRTSDMASVTNPKNNEDTSLRASRPRFGKQAGKKTAAPDFTPQAQTSTEKSGGFRILPRASGQVLKSWLLWRIVLTVSFTIILIQAVTLAFNFNHVEQEKRLEIQNMARAAIVPILNNPAASIDNEHTPVLGLPEEQAATLSDITNPPPINEDSAAQLLNTTLIKGLAVYKAAVDPLKTQTQPLTLIKSYGTPLETKDLRLNQIQDNVYNADKTTYEFILTADQLNQDYIIAVSADASHIKSYMIRYAVNTIGISLALALIVTVILILAISHWLLDPILFMRNNLKQASDHPERPNIPASPFNPEDEIGGAIVIAQNLIKQNAFNLQQIKSSAEDKIYKLAYFDSLTTLPNRSFFLQKVERAIKPMSDRPAQNFFIVAIDLDNFKDINDSMGHNVGDAILRNVGKRLKSAMPQYATVSRTGEDEFAVMLEIKNPDESTEDVANKILDIIRKEPFKVFNEDLQVRASAGVAKFPRDGEEAEQLVKNADIALNRAKEDGRNTFKEYSADFDRAIQARFQILRDLRDAMEQDQLVLFYQPQLDLRSGRIIGAEALIRWWKPDDSKEGGTYISPGEFIPVAEQSGLIVPMGEWIIRRACLDAKEWNETYGFDTRVAINVSAMQFAQSDITAYTKQTLEDVGLPPEKIELEVTESVFMDDINHTIQVLKDLHNLGVELAIDDFGTGYSSLSYLRQFPIDRLKIDQSFIRNALEDPDDASIAKTIIALGRSLNLKVIAEGVETREHENFLISEGCDEVQGFRYSKPLPNDRFIEFCKDYNGDLRSFSRI